MVTDTHPIDYKKKIVLISQLVRVCAICGGNTCLNPRTNQRVCMTCDGTEIAEVYEHQLEDFRLLCAARLDALMEVVDRPEYNS